MQPACCVSRWPGISSARQPKRKLARAAPQSKAQEANAWFGSFLRGLNPSPERCLDARWATIATRNRWLGHKLRSSTMLRTALGIHFGNSLGPGHASSLYHAVAYSGHERLPVWTRIGRAGHHRHAGHTPVPGGEWAILRDPRSGYGVPGGADRADADAVPVLSATAPLRVTRCPSFLLSVLSARSAHAPAHEAGSQGSPLLQASSILRC